MSTIIIFVRILTAIFGKKLDETKEYVYGYTLFLIVNFRGIANAMFIKQ